MIQRLSEISKVIIENIQSLTTNIPERTVYYYRANLKFNVFYTISLESSRKQSLKPLPSNSNFSSTYTEMLGQLQFGKTRILIIHVIELSLLCRHNYYVCIIFTSETISLNSVSFYFSSQLTNTQASSSRIKRIAKEIFSLRSSLILSPSSSAFVRTFEENMEGMKAWNHLYIGMVARRGPLTEIKKKEKSCS